jgi:hypothetical protein
VIIAAPPSVGVRKIRGFRLELSCSPPISFSAMYFPERINPNIAVLNDPTAVATANFDTRESRISCFGIIRDSALIFASSHLLVLFSERLISLSPDERLSVSFRVQNLF